MVTILLGFSNYPKKWYDTWKSDKKHGSYYCVREGFKNNLKNFGFSTKGLTHPRTQGFVKKEKQYAGESPTFSGLIQTAGQL